MPNIKEWFKGIGFFIFITMVFYFLWGNIFSNLIQFVGTDLFNIGGEGTTSLTILKSMAWVSFVIIYLSIGGIYLIYSIIVGSRGEVKTKPVEFIKAIAIWSVSMPILSFIYGISHTLINALNNSNVLEAGLQNQASSFSWVFSILILVILTVFPFYYILKGYGVELLKTTSPIE